MRLPILKLPSLYYSADSASATTQNNFLWTIRLEYFLLFIAASLSSTKNLTSIGPLPITITITILALIFIMKIYKKLDQEWYCCRALAESIKTSTWRFCMRAHPFQDSHDVSQPKKEFRQLMGKLLTSHQNISACLTSKGNEYFTDSMMHVRAAPLNSRISYYIINRIDEQHSWYSRKSEENKKAFRNWGIITITVYIAAAVALNSASIGIPWATYAFDPLLVVVTSTIGWIQMKRHSELRASYNLTAQEIALIRS